MTQLKEKIDFEINYYKLLELKTDCDKIEIKKAYKTLSKKFHPDLNPDNPEATNKFQEINKAYTILNDMDSKSKYDEYLNKEKYKNEKLSKMSDKKRKMKEDLEDREKISQLNEKKQKTEQNEQNNIEKIKESNKKILETKNVKVEKDYIVKIKTLETINQEKIKEIFQIFGEIKYIVNKKKSYLIGFNNELSLSNCLNYDFTKTEYKLTVQKIGNETQHKPKTEKEEIEFEKNIFEKLKLMKNKKENTTQKMNG
jgi:curved DNA-binding protein CbpA